MRMPVTGVSVKNATVRLKSAAIAVFFLSAMTFFLPRETFDPHLGVGADIFCKSLYSIGNDSQDAGDLIDTHPVYVRYSVLKPVVLLVRQIHGSDPTRAPPR